MLNRVIHIAFHDRGDSYNVLQVISNNSRDHSLDLKHFFQRVTHITNWLVTHITAHFTIFLINVICYTHTNQWFIQLNICTLPYFTFIEIGVFNSQEFNIWVARLKKNNSERDTHNADFRGWYFCVCCMYGYFFGFKIKLRVLLMNEKLKLVPKRCHLNRI